MFSESHAAGAADARQQSQAPGCRGAIWTIPQACPAPPTCWCRPRQAMLLTGGAAAEAVLAEMGADGAGVARECLPVAFAGDRRIIAKSGGFGDEKTLATILAMFRGE